MNQEASAKTLSFYLIAAVIEEPVLDDLHHNSPAACDFLNNPPSVPPPASPQTPPIVQVHHITIPNLALTSSPTTTPTPIPVTEPSEGSQSRSSPALSDVSTSREELMQLLPRSGSSTPPINDPVARELGLKVPISEVDPSILPRTLNKAVKPKGSVRIWRRQFVLGSCLSPFK